MIEKHLEAAVSDDLYREAHNIAANENVKHNISSSNLEMLRDNLSAIADYQDTIIGIINNKGEIVLSTGKDISPDTPIKIENFDPTAWGSNYYQTGDFYGYFHDTRLSVIAPITADMTTKGYVSIHYLMSDLYQNRGKSCRFSTLYFLQFTF